MIYLADINHKITKEYLASNSKNPFAVRVKGLLNAYGNYPALYDFWYQSDDNKNITAYIIKYGGEFIVDIPCNSNIHLFNEIIDLCKMAGGICIMCKKITFCNISNAETGIVMKLDYFKNGCEILTNFTLKKDVDLVDYYKVLQENNSDNFIVPKFEDFYVDLHHRLRKNSARILGLYNKAELISCCTATAVHNSSAVIAGVVTLPAHKGRGYGTITVTEMCKYLISEGINNIYLQRNINENYSFYKRIGFEDISEFQQITLSK